MKVSWLLEKDVFGDADLKASVTAIQEQNMIVKQAEYIPFAGSTLDLSYFNDNECVVFHGSLNFAKVIQRYAKWVPGVYYTVKNYECSTYYNYFGKYHINNDYMMLPFGELDRMKEFLFDTLGKDATIFVRPNSGSKQFTGQTMCKDTWEKDLELIGFYDVIPEEMVVVSSPKRIAKEYRFIISGNTIVTGCEYSLYGMHSETAMDLDVYALHPVVLKVHEILADVTWRPDAVFVMDICRTDSGKCYLLEIGCFSCAGLYACNREAIVKTVSRLALDEYTEYMDV